MADRRRCTRCGHMFLFLPGMTVCPKCGNNHIPKIRESGVFRYHCSDCGVIFSSNKKENKCRQCGSSAVIQI